MADDHCDKSSDLEHGCGGCGGCNEMPDCNRSMVLLLDVFCLCAEVKVCMQLVSQVLRVTVGYTAHLYHLVYHLQRYL
jgi:hypothetical protein